MRERKKPREDIKENDRSRSRDKRRKKPISLQRRKGSNAILDAERACDGDESSSHLSEEEVYSKSKDKKKNAKPRKKTETMKTGRRVRKKKDDEKEEEKAVVQRKKKKKTTRNLVKKPKKNKGKKKKGRKGANEKILENQKKGFEFKYFKDRRKRGERINEPMEPLPPGVSEDRRLNYSKLVRRELALPISKRKSPSWKVDDHGNLVPPVKHRSAGYFISEFGTAGKGRWILARECRGYYANCSQRIPVQGHLCKIAEDAPTLDSVFLLCPLDPNCASQGRKSPGLSKASMSAHIHWHRVQAEDPLAHEVMLPTRAKQFCSLCSTKIDTITQVVSHFGEGAKCEGKGFLIQCNAEPPKWANEPEAKDKWIGEDDLAKWKEKKGYNPDWSLTG